METRELKSEEDVKAAKQWHCKKLEEAMKRNDIRSVRYHMAGIFDLDADIGERKGVDERVVKTYRRMSVRARQNSDRTIWTCAYAFMAGLAVARNMTLVPNEGEGSQNES